MSVIDIEKKGRRIEIRSRGPLPGFKSAIPGAYQNANGVWTVPLSFESCKLLRERFGKRLRIGGELSRWAKGVQQNRAYMAELASANDARLDVLPRVAPKLAKAMRRRKYQRVGARFIADTHACLIADEPGLGKTLIGMGGIIESEVPGPYLVISYPKIAVRLVWKREIERWLPPQHRAITLGETRTARERKLRLSTLDENTWLIIHPEMVMAQTWLICEECGKQSKQVNKRRRNLACGHLKTPKTRKHDVFSYPMLFDVKWGAIVVDESHESLIKRSGSVTQRRNGLEKLLLRPDGLRIAISGSPDGSMPHQLWGTLNWLDPKTYSAFHRWAELFWQKTGYTGFEIGDFRQDRESMLWDSLSGIVLRRTKVEVAPDLPLKMHLGTPLDPKDETSPVGIWLPMEGEQERAYQQMLKHSTTELESGRLEALSALAELTRLKQLACAYGDIDQRRVRGQCQSFVQTGVEECHDCARFGWHEENRFKFIPQLPSNKFNWITDNLQEWGFPSRPITKVIIVSFYTSLLQMYARELEQFFKTKSNNPLTCMITGRVTPPKRDAIVRRFNDAGNEQIMLLNVKAGGSAITIDSADRMIFPSQTRRPYQQSQAEDRIHRVSNPRQCMYYYLNSVDTVDVGTALVNQELEQGSRRWLDKRRGVEYLRHVINLSK